MGMWDPTNCETCDGGLRPWGRRAPNGGEVSLYEESPVDVGNRYGVLGAGATTIGLGDDEAPPIDSNPGSQTSNEATDQGSGGDSGFNPLINPVTANPGEAISANGNATGTTQTTTTTSSGGIFTDASATSSSDPTPYVIGGLALAAVGGLGYYLYRRHKKARR